MTKGYYNQKLNNFETGVIRNTATFDTDNQPSYVISATCKDRCYTSTGTYTVSIDRGGVSILHVIHHYDFLFICNTKYKFFSMNDLSKVLNIKYN